MTMDMLRIKRLNNHGNSHNPHSSALQKDEMTSLAEKKKAIWDSIAKLRQQVSEGEEDEELRMLKQEEEELREQLNCKRNARAGNTRTGGKNGSSTCNASHNTNSSGRSSVNAINQLKNITGVQFDMKGFSNKDEATGTEELNHLLSLTGSVPKSSPKAVKRSSKSECVHGGKHARGMEEAESESSGSENESQSESGDSDCEKQQELSRTNKKKGKYRSGLYDRRGDTKLVSNEWYAHTGLDEVVGRERSLDELSFNLLVAGELEIIGS